MKISTKSFINYVIPVLFGLVLALGYYLDAKEATITSTSSDQWNILPVCIKLDYPNLYEGDLFAHNARDVKYYTPFFVESIRFFAGLSDGNYIEGLNKLNFCINAIFSIAWYLFFFRLMKNMPLALLMSLIVRGILWMPGYELWGAGALWTALPRTAYIALLPIPLLLFNPFIRSNGLRYAGAFSCGLIANFHPISGLGVGIALIFSISVYELFERKKPAETIFLQTFISGLLVVAGLLPFIYTYWKYVLAIKATDPILFNEMIPLRIGDIFHNPLLAIKKFTQWRWVMLIGGPILGTLLIFKKLPKRMKRASLFGFIFLISVLLLSLLVVPMESLVRSFGLDIHMAFQLIRNVKYVIVPVFVFCSIILWFLVEHVGQEWRIRASYLLLILFIGLLSLARFSPFNKLPLVGDDCIRATLPNTYSLKKEVLYEEDDDLDEIFNWINANIPADARFIGPAQLRTACQRSIIFDGKGASMVIEGNPDRFVEWGRRSLDLKACVGWNEKMNLYQAWGAEYVLVKEKFPGQNLLYSQGHWFLYALQSKEDHS